MARISYAQFQQEKQFFEDYWAFRKAFYNGYGEDELFWGELTRAVVILENKYTDAFQRALLLECVADIERRAKQ